MADLFPFVSCVWDDAWADATDSVGERDHDAKHKPTVMETMGWLLRDDALGISLFNERCLDKGEELYRSRTFVPRAMIRSVTVLKLSRPRTKRQAVPPSTPQIANSSTESPQ